MRFLGKLVQSKVAAIGLGIVLLVLVCAIFGPWIVPYDPAEQDIMQRMLPPLARADSGEFHLLGTDATPTSSDTRAPTMSRLNRSRPSASVPSR